MKTFLGLMIFTTYIHIQYFVAYDFVSTEKKVRVLVIDNKYFGHIEFLDPGDLSDIALASFYGKLVQFKLILCILSKLSY